MRTANFTELRTNLKSYLDAVINNSEPLIVQRPSNQSVVVISLAEYNAIKETQYIMSSPAMMDVIRQGDRQIAEGHYFSQKDGESIEDFLNRASCIE